jgi:membrane-associated protease RseP (regulator of RpoE activity)
VDLTTFLILGVALLIVFSGYVLFNDVPRLGGARTRRRR